jgi:hypothetical protein
VHPALHIVRTESNECDARPGITWAARVLAGRSGKSRVQVCVDCTLSPFCRQAMRGTVARTMFVADALVVKKWLIAPESRMADHYMVVTSTLIVLRRMEAARAQLWVGVGQQFVLTEVTNLLLPTPACQKYPGIWLGCWLGA